MAAALAGCAQLTTPFDNYIPLITQFGIYKLDINQGNYISQDMVDKLKPGQTKAQVRTMLGTPLIASAFRDNRWDYVYEFQSGAGCRAPPVHRLLQGRPARPLGRRRDAEVGAGDEPDRRDARLPEDPYGQDAGIIGKIIDMFKRCSGQPDRLTRVPSANSPERAARRASMRIAVTVRVAIAGAGGRMGQALIEAVLAQPALALAAALDVAGSPAVGREAGERFRRSWSVPTSMPRSAAPTSSIDFTRPEGTLAHPPACARHGVAAVVGTTGLDEAQKAALRDHGERDTDRVRGEHERRRQRARCRWSSRPRAGSARLRHRGRRDAPQAQGRRAVGHGAAPRRGRGRGHGPHLADCAVYARDGATGERKPGTIGFAALRGGDVVGEHTVVFAGNGERVELVASRDVAADVRRGCAARGRVRRREAREGQTGLFDMPDVLGLR